MAGRLKRDELEQIGSKLGINCGGKGGKPGPCKSKLSGQPLVREKDVPVTERHKAVQKKVEA